MKIVITEQQLKTIIGNGIYGKRENIFENTSDCENSRGYDKLKLAVDWWKKWLNNDTTKTKFGKLHKENKNTVDRIFSNYNLLLDNVKLQYVSDTSMPNSAWVYIKGYKRVTIENYYLPITINCIVQERDIVSTMIHEIQHILNNYYPLRNDQGQTSLNFLNHDYLNPFKSSYDFNLNTKLNKFAAPKINFIEIKNDKKKQDELFVHLTHMGFNSVGANKIINDFVWRLKNDVYHLETPNETTSIFYEIRKLLKLKSGENITPDMLIKNANNENVVILLSVWLYSKKSLTEFLTDYNNSIVKNTDTPVDNTSTTV
jgi:hypothetical protein